MQPQELSIECWRENPPMFLELDMTFLDYNIQNDEVLSWGHLHRDCIIQIELIKLLVNVHVCLPSEI